MYSSTDMADSARSSTLSPVTSMYRRSRTPAWIAVKPATASSPSASLKAVVTVIALCRTEKPWATARGPSASR